MPIDITAKMILQAILNADQAGNKIQEKMKN